MGKSASQSWRSYPYRSGELTFPDDEGVHEDKPYGWWYVNLHLTDEEGHRIILFTSFVSGVNEQLGSIADLSRGRHLNQYSVGEVRASAHRLDVSFNDDRHPPNHLRQCADQPFSYDFRYALSGYEFELRFDAVKPPYALAQTGLVRQLPTTYSYYYVQPRLQVSGHLRRDDGSEQRVKGIGWLDRQWYPGTNSGTDIYMGHFWSAIHLSDGTDIAAYRCLGDKGESKYPLFELMRPDNTYAHYPVNTIRTTRTFRTDPIGAGRIREFEFPLSASIVHKPTGTALQLMIATDNPMDNALDLGAKGCFFEGGFDVAGTHQGEQVTGEAFVEVSLFGALEGPLEVPDWRQRD